MINIVIEEEILRPSQLAKKLGWCTRTILRAIHAKKLKASPFNGQWYIHRADVFAWLSQHPTPSREYEQLDTPLEHPRARGRHA